MKVYTGGSDVKYGQSLTIMLPLSLMQYTHMELLRTSQYGKQVAIVV